DRIPVYSAHNLRDRAADEFHETLSTQLVRVRTAGLLAPELSIVRALRPLKRVAPSPSEVELDEEATAQRYAKCGRWLPVMHTAQVPWRDLVLVIDRGPSSVLWAELAEELHRILQQLGAFGKIRVRYLRTNKHGRLGLARTPQSGSLRPPSELVDPSGRQIIL